MLKNEMALLWSISSAGISWRLTLCEKSHTFYISFRFVSFFFILSFFLFFHYYMELAWQQMNANEQNDFRIVSVNLYTIKNNLALNQLWIDYHTAVLCCWSCLMFSLLPLPPRLFHCHHCCTCHFLDIYKMVWCQLQCSSKYNISVKNDEWEKERKKT